MTLIVARADDFSALVLNLMTIGHETHDEWFETLCDVTQLLLDAPCPMSVRQMTRRLEEPAERVRRVLRTLERSGFARKGADGRWCVAWREAAA